MITFILAVTFLAAIGMLYVLGQAIRVARAVTQPNKAGLTSRVAASEPV